MSNKSRKGTQRNSKYYFASENQLGTEKGRDRPVDQLTTIPTIEQRAQTKLDAYNDVKKRSDSTNNHMHYSDKYQNAYGMSTNEQTGNTKDPLKTKMVIHIDIPVEKSLRKNMNINIHNKKREDNHRENLNVSVLDKRVEHSREDRESNKSDRTVVPEKNKLSNTINMLNQKQTLDDGSIKTVSDKPYTNEKRTNYTEKYKKQKHLKQLESLKSSEDKQQAGTGKATIFKNRKINEHLTNESSHSTKSVNIGKNKSYPASKAHNPAEQILKVSAERNTDTEPFTQTNIEKTRSSVTEKVNRPSSKEANIQKSKLVKGSNKFDSSGGGPRSNRSLDLNYNTDQGSCKAVVEVNDLKSTANPKVNIGCEKDKKKISFEETNSVKSSGNNQHLINTTKADENPKSSNIKSRQQTPKQTKESEGKGHIPLLQQTKDKDGIEEKDEQSVDKSFTFNEASKLQKGKETKLSNEAGEKQRKSSPFKASLTTEKRNITPRLLTPKQTTNVVGEENKPSVHQTEDKSEIKTKSARIFEERSSVLVATTTPTTSKELDEKSFSFSEASKLKKGQEAKLSKESGEKQRKGSPFKQSLTNEKRNKTPKQLTPKQTTNVGGEEHEPSAHQTEDKSEIKTKSARILEERSSVLVATTAPKTSKELNEKKTAKSRKNSGGMLIQTSKVDDEILKPNNYSRNSFTQKHNDMHETIIPNVTIAKTPTVQSKTTAIIETHSESFQASNIRKEVPTNQDKSKKHGLFPKEIGHTSPKTFRSATKGMDDESASGINVRPGQVSPAKTAFSRHHTKASLVQDQPPVDVNESNKEVNISQHSTPEVPPLPCVPSPNETELEVDRQSVCFETDSNTLVKSKSEDNKENDNYCKFCTMSFKNKSQLEYHKSKFCISMSDINADDITSINQARDFFTLGDSAVIHSTPRVWSIAGKMSSLRRIEGNETEDNEYKSSKYYWDKCFNGRVTECAVNLGFDKVANCFVYVCRARINQELIPGKVVPAKKCAYVSSAGEQFSVTDYEVLTDPLDLLSWKHVDIDGGIPRGALKAGHDQSDLVYFVARTSAPDGSMCCGRYVPQDMKCYFPWNGKEHSAVKFDFLCKT